MFVNPIPNEWLVGSHFIDSKRMEYKIIFIGSFCTIGNLVAINV